MTARILTLMGSGETTPTMVSVHRAVLDRLGGEVDGVVLDTPVGFQENADDISRRAVEYFARSVGLRMQVASLRDADDPAAVDAFARRVGRADLVFAGPGSPTYAVRVWRRTPVRDLLVDKLRTGGAVTFASAAAITLGRRVLPVYEIYKAGIDPHWVEGLDVLGDLGFAVVVIPHYDNAEGGTHDTRYCYLGERRLRRLEAELGPDEVIWGIDEHTAAVWDLDAGTVEVAGRGSLVVRREGREHRIPAGERVGLDELAGATGRASGSATVRAAARTAAPRPTPLQEGIAGLREAARAALRTGDTREAARIAVALERLLADWATDTDENDHLDAGRAVLGGVIEQLGELAAAGAAGPRPVLAPLVEPLLAWRAEARDRRDWEVADRIRAILTAAGVEVRDTPQGTLWEVADAGGAGNPQPEPPPPPG